MHLSIRSKLLRGLSVSADKYLICCKPLQLTKLHSSDYYIPMILLKVFRLTIVCDWHVGSQPHINTMLSYFVDLFRDINWRVERLTLNFSVNNRGVWLVIVDQMVGGVKIEDEGSCAVGFLDVKPPKWIFVCDGFWNSYCLSNIT